MRVTKPVITRESYRLICGVKEVNPFLSAEKKDYAEPTAITKEWHPSAFICGCAGTWNTGVAKDHVPQGLGVQIPSTAPKRS